jgi:hypothetical protein
MDCRLSSSRVCALVFLFACAVTIGQDSATDRKSDEELASLDWKEIVQYYLRTFEKPNDAESKAYTDRLRTLLNHEGLMHIRTYAWGDGKLKDCEQLYYRPGELHVVGAAGGIDAEPGDWNLLVRDGKAYEWRTGDSSGVVSKAIDKDMIDYLIYRTDVALIDTGTFREYLRHPESFLPPKTVEDKGWIELRLKAGNDLAISELGISAVFISEDPFWIYGTELKQDETAFSTICERPTPIKSLPDNFFAPLDKIEFKERDTSLRRHLIFL